MLACPDTEVLIHAWPSFYPWQSFPRLKWIDLQRKKRTGKLSAKHRKYTMHGMEEEQGEGEGERSSLQSKHEGKMLVGSSPGSCTPMQVQVSIHHCCTREVSMNRQLHPTTSPPGLDRRELFGLLVVFVAAASFFFTTVAKW